MISSTLRQPPNLQNFIRHIQQQGLSATNSYARPDANQFQGAPTTVLRLFRASLTIWHWECFESSNCRFPSVAESLCVLRDGAWEGSSRARQRESISRYGQGTSWRVVRNPLKDRVRGEHYVTLVNEMHAADAQVGIMRSVSLPFFVTQPHPP